MSWLIVRVFAGHPFEVELTLQGLGVEAYCPRYTAKRRHPFLRRRKIDVIRPLFPGYLFVRPAAHGGAPFNAERVNNSRLKMRLMARDGRHLLVTESEMRLVRAAETKATEDEARPVIGDIVRAMVGILSAVGPKKFTKLGDLQARKKVAA